MSERVNRVKGGKRPGRGGGEWGKQGDGDQVGKRKRVGRELGGRERKHEEQEAEDMVGKKAGRSQE